MSSFGFHAQLRVGDVGVRRLVRTLKHDNADVTNLTKDKAYQQRDVDLIVNGLLVEVKTDTHPSENLFLELTCGDKPGCVFKSRADIWAYAFPREDLCYWISLPELQWWTALHMGDYKPVVIKSHRNKSRWKATGIAVPVAHLRLDGLVVQEFQLDEE